jgi:DNA-binding MarR family transcriptional regulator
VTDRDSVLQSAGYLLMKAGHYIGLEFETVLAEFDLSGREFLVLSFVRASDALSQQQLSERLNLDPTIVVGLLDALEQRDLLSRAKHPADRRRNVLALTEGGLRLHGAAVAAAEAAEAAFLAELSTAERAELRMLLRTVLVPRLAWLS